MEGGIFIRFHHEVPKVLFIYTPALKIAVLGGFESGQYHRRAKSNQYQQLVPLYQTPSSEDARQ
jgi:hypothetical protein